MFVFANYSPGEAQMSILQDLPFNLSEAGPEEVAGVGNFCLQIRAPAPSELPVSTLYFFDSHGQKSSNTRKPDYDYIEQNQIDWFVNTSQAQRSVREKRSNVERYHPSLAFFPDLCVRGGCRGEPTEGPSFNSHLFNALREEGVSAACCGHDHVNDFCALLPPRAQHNSAEAAPAGPWLCYAGTSGFGGYCSYGRKRFYRQARVLEIDTSAGNLTTWKRVEYAKDRVDEIILVKSGVVVVPPLEISEKRGCVVN
jgi:hypothetical protein